MLNLGSLKPLTTFVLQNIKMCFSSQISDYGYIFKNELKTLFNYAYVFNLSDSIFFSHLCSLLKLQYFTWLVFDMYVVFFLQYRPN